MFDPQLAINTALYAALTTPPIPFEGDALPVYAHVPRNADDYLLISQPTLVEGFGFAACASWDCTMLLSIYTGFADEETVSESFAYALSNEVLMRLLGQRLALGGGLQMSPITVALATTTQTSDSDKVYVARILRLRFTVYAER